MLFSCVGSPGQIKFKEIFTRDDFSVNLKITGALNKLDTFNTVHAVWFFQHINNI